MGSILEYKGYHTKVEYDTDDKVLRGKISGISDYVDFEADSIARVEDEFHRAVDDYLEYCKALGKIPDKEYKGTFNVRISPELHREIAYIALAQDISLNSSVEKAISDYVVKETNLLNQYGNNH